jgi:hypothetical protein
MAAQATKRLSTVFGWQIYVGATTNTRMIANFPMQANGAEILRLAIIYCVAARIEVCAPVHDALLIEANSDDIEDAVTRTIEVMKRASTDVLGNGFELRCEAEIVRYPDRYSDKGGAFMWSKVSDLLRAVDAIHSEVKAVPITPYIISL